MPKKRRPRPPRVCLVNLREIADLHQHADRQELALDRLTATVTALGQELLLARAESACLRELVRLAAETAPSLERMLGARSAAARRANATRRIREDGIDCGVIPMNEELTR